MLEAPKLTDAEQFVDERGKFIPSLLDKKWVQINVSVSRRGVFRGMHFQAGKAAQAKLVRVLNGSLVDVIVDLRNIQNNPDYLKVSAFDLVSDNKKSTYPRLYVPKGFAHGFLALEDNTIFEYQVDAEHEPEKDRAINWKSFPILQELFAKHNIGPGELIISSKDKEAVSLDEWRGLNEDVL